MYYFSFYSLRHNSFTYEFIVNAHMHVRLHDYILFCGIFYWWLELQTLWAETCWVRGFHSIGRGRRHQDLLKAKALVLSTVAATLTLGLAIICAQCIVTKNGQLLSTTVDIRPISTGAWSIVVGHTKSTIISMMLHPATVHSTIRKLASGLKGKRIQCKLWVQLHVKEFFDTISDGLCAVSSLSASL